MKCLLFLLFMFIITSCFALDTNITSETENIPVLFSHLRHPTFLGYDRTFSPEVKIHYLINKVEDILEISLPEGKTVNIVVLKNKKELNERRQNIIENKDKTIVLAFYHYKTNTIYVSKENFTINSLVHEITHLILNNYYKQLMPNRISETMAEYIEDCFR